VIEADLQSQINSARAYDALFVPALFGQWVGEVANAAQLKVGQSVLDVACGTGVLASEVASRVGAEGRVAGVDPSLGMLTVAKEHLPNVDWRVGTAESIPFADASFDASVSQFGLMFFQDQNQSIKEMLRVLRPSGRLVIAVWDSIENNPGYSAELKLIERLGGAAAADAVRAPFVLGRHEEVRAMIDEAGAKSTTVRTRRGKACFPSIQTMVEAELRGWLPVMGVQLSEEVIATILQAAEPALASYTTADGKVEFDVFAHVISARKR
jgi:ubiquinone/menaquinone biosynthesis C-methylase UbiE